MMQPKLQNDIYLPERTRQQINNECCLYILMRTDLDSMNPGKAVAQGAHAANQFVNFINPDCEQYKHWFCSTPKGFGTTICLSVDGDQLNTTIGLAGEHGFISGIVTDPTYPIQDGKFRHLISLDTCGYIFGCRDEVRPYLDHLELMP